MLCTKSSASNPNTIIIILLQVYTKMMQSGLEEGVVAVERERARVNKIINDKVISFYYN